jgi:hypothetical protein
LARLLNASRHPNPRGLSRESAMLRDGDSPERASIIFARKKQTKVAVHELWFSNLADSTNPSSKIYKSQGPAFITSCDEIAVEIIFAGRTEQHELLDFRSPPKLVADHYSLHVGVDDIVDLHRTRAGRCK